MNTFRCLRLMMLLFVGSGVLCGQTAPAKKKGGPPRLILDTMLVRYDHTPIYDSASYTAGIIGDIQAGERVIVVEKIGKFGRFQRESGFGFIAKVNLAELPSNRPTSQPTAQPTPSSIPSAGNATTDSLPALRHSPTAPSKKTDQQPTAHRCKGLTKSRKQCSRNAEEGSDYCWQHRPGNETTNGTNKRATPRRKP